MNKYLLLRDNKQSGPYSVPELIEKGIKPYDLVWLDGRSVSWRYPSEIEELKAYSPVIEEQPFDRFYKRPEPVVKTAPIAAEHTAVERSPYEPKVTVEAAPELPAQKKVYINFPATPPPVKRAPEYKAIVTDTAPPVAPVVRETVHYPEKPQYSNNTSSNKNYVYYAAAACIILLGFVVVLFLNNRNQKEQLQELNTIVKQIENKKANEAAVTPIPFKNVTPEPAPSQTSETIVNPELLADNDYSKPKTDAKEPATATTEHATAPKVSEKPVEIAPGVTYKEKPVLRRSDNQQQDASPAANEKVESTTVPSSSENLFKQVSVKPSNYKTGVLGGISNLQFELTNNSKHELYKVAIEIKYLGPEKKVVNRQTVYFENVSPGEHSTIEVPKSKRGVSIDYAITDIKS